jgi:hypothetical protein
MTCTPLDEAPRTLKEATARAQCWAGESLVTGERPLLDAVWWLSTHLAAADRVLYRELWKMRDQRAEIASQRRLARAIESALWSIDRLLTGDGRLAGRALEPQIVHLRALVHEYTVGERRSLERLSDRTSQERLDRLAREYAVAVGQAPTRPHPLTQRTRVLRRFSFRLVGRVDHLRDSLDSRHVPRRKRRTTPEDGAPMDLPSVPVQRTTPDQTTH